MRFRRSRRRGITSFDACTILILLAIAAVVAWPRVRISRILAAEDAAVADLQDLSRRMREFIAAKTLDADGDGIGEAPPLGSLLGARRDQATPVAMTAAVTAAVTAATTHGGPEDVWRIGGYRFAVLVPGGSTRTPVLAGSKSSTPRLSACAWMIVAWPAEPGTSGMRAYAATPGAILVHKIDGYPYDDSPPFPAGKMAEPDGTRLRRLEPRDTDWIPPPRTLR